MQFRSSPAACVREATLGQETLRLEDSHEAQAGMLAYTMLAQLTVSMMHSYVQTTRTGFKVPSPRSDKLSVYGGVKEYALSRYCSLVRPLHKFSLIKVPLSRGRTKSKSPCNL